MATADALAPIADMDTRRARNGVTRMFGGWPAFIDAGTCLVMAKCQRDAAGRQMAPCVQNGHRA
jgi:hypothetical protein